MESSQEVVVNGRGGVAVYGKRRSFLGRTGPYDDQVLKQRIPPILSEAVDHRSHELLDLGSGSGELAERMITALQSDGRSVGRAVLSDPVESHLKKIKSRPFIQSGVDADWISVRNIDLYNDFPVDLGKFDLVTCVSVLMHVGDDVISEVIERILNAATPGGDVLIVTKNPIVASSCYHHLGGELYQIPDTEIVETYRSREEYEQLITDNGGAITNSCRLPISPLPGVVVPDDYQAIVGQWLWDLILATPVR